MANKIIVLMTDFGNDFYVGQMKAVIKSIYPAVEIVDLCHNILPQNVAQAAVILHSSYKYFPKHSIFVCVVDPGVGTEREILLVKTKDFIFIVPNNGIITKVFKDNPGCKIYAVYNSKFFLNPVSKTFHGRDIFSPVAAYILKGINVTKICKPFNKDKLQLLNGLTPKLLKVHNKKVFIGKYIFYDSFGNIVTNLTSDLVDMGKLNCYCLEIKYGSKKIGMLKLKNCYSDVNPGEFLAYINSFGYIEIGVNQDNAYQILAKKFSDFNKLQFWLYERTHKG